MLDRVDEISRELSYEGHRLVFISFPRDAGHNLYDQVIDKVTREFAERGWTIFLPSRYSTTEAIEREIKLCSLVYVMNCGGYEDEAMAQQIQVAVRLSKEISRHSCLDLASFMANRKRIEAGG